MSLKTNPGLWGIAGVPRRGLARSAGHAPEGTKPFRASIVARARFLEDLVEEQAGLGVDQYVILGAGLDTGGKQKARDPLAPPRLRGSPTPRRKPCAHGGKGIRLDRMLSGEGTVR